MRPSSSSLHGRLLEILLKKTQDVFRSVEVLINRFREGKKSALSFYPHPSYSSSTERAREMRGERKQRKCIFFSLT